MTQHLTAHLSPVLMAAAADAPEWVHLLPVGANGMIQTDDARGPYRVADLSEIVAASMATADRLPIDQDHANDLAAPKGLPAPARGWIVAMETRADGIWGKVEWTGEGRALVADRAYRGISPVLLHDKAKVVRAIARASLVNRPNLKGLVALNSATQETEMDQIAEALGLKAGASVEDILAAIAAMKDTPDDDERPDPALQASLQAANAAVAALRADVARLTTSLNARDEADKRGRAEAFIDRAIAEKRAGLNAGTRDYFVSLHMTDPAGTEAAIGQMPQLGHTGMSTLPPAAVGGEISLNAADLDAARLLGIPVKQMLAARKKEALQ